MRQTLAPARPGTHAAHVVHAARMPHAVALARCMHLIVTLLAGVGVALLLAACSSPSDQHQPGTGEDASFPQAKVAPEAAPELASRSLSVAGAGAARTGDSPAGTGSLEDAAAQPRLADGAPMLIRTGEASIEVADMDSAAAAVHALAGRVGGYVTSSSRQSGEYELRSATIQLRVPAGRFDDAMSGLRPLGRVEYVNVNAEDVGEEYTDLQARMANQKRLEARLVELLANRTGKLEDVLAVERELARVRETIERYEGRVRYLDARVALSTLTVTVHERAPLAGINPGRNPVVAAFGQAWRNFVGFVAGFIAALGVLVPLGLLAWVAWWSIRRARKARHSGRSSPPPAGGAPGTH